ncbi:MAG: cyclic lactone autoinducer peptide [Lachnospiraceae bacterium]|nr:cyclic lactone autoinducer peptide [Lachnospiraceae bacterium]
MDKPIRRYSMNKVVENVLKKGMDKLGDSMIEKACPFILYQPKACARKAVDSKSLKDKKTKED